MVFLQLNRNEISNQLNPAHDCIFMLGLGRIEKPGKLTIQARLKVDVLSVNVSSELAVLHGPTFPDLEEVRKRQG